MVEQNLAKRAIACKHWRWMPGMRAIGGCVVATGCPLWLVDGVPRMPVDREHYMWLRETSEHPECVLPDHSDPATLGCLLALVREAAQEPGLHVRCMLPYAPDMSGKSPPPWVLHSGRGQRWGDRHDTEAEALVAALEAAP